MTSELISKDELILDDLLAPRRPERVALQVEILVFGRDASIADFHAPILSSLPRSEETRPGTAGSPRMPQTSLRWPWLRAPPRPASVLSTHLTAVPESERDASLNRIRLTGTRSRAEGDNSRGVSSNGYCWRIPIRPPAARMMTAESP